MTKLSFLGEILWKYFNKNIIINDCGGSAVDFTKGNTVLSKLCRAGEGGDLEAVFGDRNETSRMEGFSRLSLFLFHFSIRARQSQIRLGVVSFLHIHL